MGICPQFNILWDDLTVEEHLYFYARLKGIPGSFEDSHVENCLKEVGLHKVKSRLSSQLSGGMKRRLSVAVSLVGNSDIVFFDEPTTYTSLIHFSFLNTFVKKTEAWIQLQEDNYGKLYDEPQKEEQLFSPLILWMKSNCFALELLSLLLVN